MNERYTRAVEHAKAAGSGLIHAVPPLRGPAARYILNLTEPNDRMLRWRVAKTAAVPEGWWGTMKGQEGASDYDPGQWENGVFGVDRRSFEDDVACGGQPAVAYRAAGAVAVVGVRRIKPRNEFFVPVSRSGEPDPDGDMMGFAARAGENLEIAGGTATVNGKHFFALPTRLLAPVIEVPDGLYRV